MKLSKKTLIYSMLISVIIVALIIAYFIAMLPSLYVSYMKDKNYQDTVRLQKGVMNSGSYDNLYVSNPTGTMSFLIPLEGNTVYLTSKLFKLTLTAKNVELQNMLEKLRYYAKHPDEMESIDMKTFDLTVFTEGFKQSLSTINKDFVDITGEFLATDEIIKPVKSKVHMESDELVIVESQVSEGPNAYTSYIALGLTEDTIIITVIPLMTPSIEEIRPVIFQSMPMILAIALLLVMISSQVFSRQIIQPIIRLARHAEFMKEAKNLKLEPIPITGQDEINSLGASLNGLYQKIQESYQELEIKNQCLADENKRQEVFLRASSHQLKTPITAALLLVQGMIGEIGKYKDVKTYLPQIKVQLQSMQKIVEDILSLNQTGQVQKEAIYLPDVIQACLQDYAIQIEEKEIIVNTLNSPTMAVEPIEMDTKGNKLTIKTDEALFKKILDNLISNAIRYTPQGGEIVFQYELNHLKILNTGQPIDKDILPHIFEPFVTSSEKGKGHGLGLYVVHYYAKLLGITVQIANTAKGVQADLHYDSSHLHDICYASSSEIHVQRL